jgi:NAD(P)-dependent dehydrogenase (short-subunit alcohol dehydrogenase family)
MNRAPWTAADVPDLTGRTAVITGANGGIGLEAALVLAARGARLVLACRDPGKAEAARARIRATVPGATVDLVRLDLADPGSIAAATAEVRRLVDRIDLLINNAGVMWPPFGVTAQGVELQFATNHLGHFAFTGRLIDLVLATPGSRVVTVASNGHWLVRNFDLTDLGFEKTRYRPIEAYSRSKLANLLFHHELQGRLTRAGRDTIAVAAHPGGSRTELIRGAPSGGHQRLGPRFLRPLFQPQSAAMGALCTVRAAVDPIARGGEYFGPRGPLEMLGHPGLARRSRRSRDPELAGRLWQLSEDLTGVAFPV